MFTGIIEELGAVETSGRRLMVRARTVASDSDAGASIAVNGVCLTVVDRTQDSSNRALLSFDLSPETLERTTLGDLGDGDPVNLERPLTLLTRLGGHLVQGHVDGVGSLKEVRPVEGGSEMSFTVPEDLEAYVVEKGSIAVDGVSLTVTRAGGGTFDVALIPHTLSATTLGVRDEGDRVNLEVDVVAKYVEEFMRRSR